MRLNNVVNVIVGVKTLSSTSDISFVKKRIKSVFMGLIGKRKRKLLIVD